MLKNAVVDDDEIEDDDVDNFDEKYLKKMILDFPFTKLSSS